MKKILWFSRHPAAENQVADLKKIYGEDTTVIQYGAKVSSAEDIISVYKREKADDMVIVAPLSVIAVVCQYGMHPLYAQMEQVPIEEAEVTANGRGFKFIEFRRIKKLALEFYDKI